MRDWILADRRERRVGVTARSRQIEGNQATGSLQIASEIAAPLELRTPTSTAAKAAKQSADGSVANHGAGVNGAEGQSEENSRGNREREERARERREKHAHEALPHTPPGGKPPETPAPFPSVSMLHNGGHLSRVRKPRNNSAPLTDRLRYEESTEMRERGPSEKRAAPSVQPRTTVGSARRCARMRRCLILRQGASPLRPPHFFLDRGRPSHGSRDREERSSGEDFPNPFTHPAAMAGREA